MWRLAVRTLPTVRAERVDRPDCDVFDQAGGVDANELALAAVEVDQRSGLFGILLEALRDGLGLIVVALVELAAAAVADAVVGRCVELDVPDLAAARRRAGAPAGQPADHLVAVDHQL